MFKKSTARPVDSEGSIRPQCETWQQQKLLGGLSTSTSANQGCWGGILRQIPHDAPVSHGSLLRGASDQPLILSGGGQVVQKYGLSTPCQLYSYGCSYIICIYI